MIQNQEGDEEGAMWSAATAIPGGALFKGVGTVARASRVVVKEYQILNKYGTRIVRGASLYEKHHAIMSAWAKAIDPLYRTSQAPVIVLSEANHLATQRAFEAWAKAEGYSARSVPWAKLSLRQVGALTEKMFDAANVPAAARAAYWKAFADYVGGLY